MQLEVRIERLGAQGDGVAQGPDGPLFVPFTLPGELVTVEAGPETATPRRSPFSSRARSASPRSANISEPAAAARSSTWRLTPISPGSASLSSRRSPRVGLRRRSRRSAPCLSPAGGGRRFALGRTAQRHRLRLSRRPLARHCRHRRLPGAQPRHRRATAQAQIRAGAAAWWQARSPHHRHRGRAGPRCGCRGHSPLACAVRQAGDGRVQVSGLPASRSMGRAWRFAARPRWRCPGAR